MGQCVPGRREPFVRMQCARDVGQCAMRTPQRVLTEHPRSIGRNSLGICIRKESKVLEQANCIVTHLACGMARRCRRRRRQHPSPSQRTQRVRFRRCVVRILDGLHCGDMRTCDTSDKWAPHSGLPPVDIWVSGAGVQGTVVPHEGLIRPDVRRIIVCVRRPTRWGRRQDELQQRCHRLTEWPGVGSPWRPLQLLPRPPACLRVCTAQ